MKTSDAISQIVVQLGWTETGVVVVLVAVLQYLAALWVSTRVKNSIQHAYDVQMEEYRYEIRVREQAAKVAEYMDLARNLEENSPPETYHKANQLAWELAMWLPSEVYKKMAESIANPHVSNNPLTVVIEVRGLLLGPKAGDLTADNVLHHAPGIGRFKK